MQRLLIVNRDEVELILLHFKLGIIVMAFFGHLRWTQEVLKSSC